MAIIEPFKALRPRKDIAAKTASPPYDIIDRSTAKKMVKNNPYSFLKIERAEIDLDSKIDPYSTEVYKKSKNNLNKLIKNNILIQDKLKNLYIYRQQTKNHTQTGVVCCTSIDEYQKDIIKKHELTQPEKEKDRFKHISYCEAHTGPIFQIFRSNQDINSLLKSYINSKKPVYEFITEDNVKHSIWIMNERNKISAFKYNFSKIPAFYIADGHHRSAAAVKYAVRKRNQLKDHTGNEGFNYLLSVLFPAQDVNILSYNRIIKDLNDLTPRQFLEQLQKNFKIKPEKKPYQPVKKHNFGMLLDSKWYKLTAKKDIIDAHDSVNRLDVSILHQNILKPLLNIKNPRTDQRIEYVGGSSALDKINDRITKSKHTAFFLPPVDPEELMSVADEGEIMPPKSTWFEPKLRSGIFVHQLQ